MTTFKNKLKIFEAKHEFLEAKFKNIREESDIRVESLVNQIHEMGDKLINTVKECEKEALK